MARIVLTNCAVTFGTTDISSYVTSITLSTSYDVVETTAFGNTARTRVAGLQDSTVAFEFNQDYATSALESIIYPTLGTAITVAVRPVAAVSPVYTFSTLISEWQPLSGAVGELATASVTWPISGLITKS
jgi:hypothetical protein